MDSTIAAAAGAALVAVLNELRARANARTARLDREERERQLVGRPIDGTRREDGA